MKNQKLFPFSQNARVFNRAKYGNSFFKKSQVSAEFIIFVGIAFVIAIIFQGIALKKTGELSKQKEAQAAKDLGIMLQKEVITASYVEDGYFRQFTIPDKVYNSNFSLENRNNSLTIISKNSVYIALLPSKIGNFTKGSNRINKTNGIIYIS